MKIELELELEWELQKESLEVNASWNCNSFSISGVNWITIRIGKIFSSITHLCFFLLFLLFKITGLLANRDRSLSREPKKLKYALLVERERSLPRTYTKGACALTVSEKCITDMVKSACSLAESSGKRPGPQRKRFR